MSVQKERRIPPALAKQVSRIHTQLREMQQMQTRHIRDTEKRAEALIQGVQSAKEAADFDSSQFRSAIWALQADLRRVMGDIELEYALQDDVKTSAEALVAIND